MKNLETYGVHELNLNETTEISGGFFWGIFVVVAFLVTWITVTGDAVEAGEQP